MNRYSLICSLLLILSISYVNCATRTITVTLVSGTYYIDGAQNPQLYFNSYDTLIIQASNLPAAHPVEICNTQTGTCGNAAPHIFPTGGSGVPGNDTSAPYIFPKVTTETNYSYGCAIHSTIIGNIITVRPYAGTAYNVNVEVKTKGAAANSANGQSVDYWLTIGSMAEQEIPAVKVAPGDAITFTGGTTATTAHPFFLCSRAGCGSGAPALGSAEGIVAGTNEIATSGATFTWIVPSGANYFYGCNIHANMGNVIGVNPGAGFATSMVSFTSIALVLLFSTLSVLFM